MRTLQEKYNAVLEGKFSKTQFRRDAAIEMPQFVSTVNSFDDTVSILKNKGAITEAKVLNEAIDKPLIDFAADLKKRLLAVGFTDVRVQSPSDLRVGQQVEDALKEDPKRAFIQIMEPHSSGNEEGQVVVGDQKDSKEGLQKVMDYFQIPPTSGFGSIQKDNAGTVHASKVERYMGGLAYSRLYRMGPGYKKGAMTEAQEPKYTTASPADTIAPDVLDTGIKFELDKKYGTLDVTPEQFEKCREMAIKNLSKDVLYYVKQDSIQLDEPGEKMEKAKLNEETDALFARNLKAAGYDYKQMLDNLGDAVAAEQGLEDASAEELKIYAQIAQRLGDDIDVYNALDYLESLPNYRPEFTPDNLRKANEAGVLVTSPDGETRPGNGKDGNPEMSDKEAEEYIKNAKKHPATPMGTKFEKTDEAIQNIENDEYTIKRIAKLTNQLLKDVDPRDEDHAVKAYAISVKNDLESGDASRLKRYKDLLSIDDLKDDMRHYISHDVDQLEEDELEERTYFDPYDELEENAIGMTDSRLSSDQHSKLDNAVRGDSAYSFGNDPYADDQLRYKYAKKMGFLEEEVDEDQDFTLTPDEREEQEREKFASYSTGKERKALKEMFKKIITKVIND